MAVAEKLEWMREDEGRWTTWKTWRIVETNVLS
jgi:hypothetical protein